ncbi:methyl-accepting chemotaxis protein [Magnetococcales bacterium HHB-1]
MQLQQGPLKRRAGWLHIALIMADAEKVRLTYLENPSEKNAQALTPLLTRLTQKLEQMPTESTQSVHQGQKRYAQAFTQVVHAITSKTKLRQQLLLDREAVETEIYALDDGDLEEVIGEFFVAEVIFFAERTKDKAHAVKVILDRFLRDVAGAEQERQVQKAIENYRRTFEAIEAKDILVIERTKTMEEIATHVTKTVLENVHAADHEAIQAAKTAHNEAKDAQNRALLWTIIGVIVAAAMTFLFERIFQRRIQATLAGFRTLASGDLTFRFSVPERSPNELYHLVDEANTMADTLSELLKIIIDKSNDLNHMTERLKQTQVALLAKSEDGTSLVRRITEKNDQVDHLSHKVHQHAVATYDQANASKEASQSMSMNIMTIAAAAEQASVNVSSMATAAEQMSANLTDVNHSLAETSTAVSSVASSIKQLDISLVNIRQRCQDAGEESEYAKKHVESSQKIIDHLSRSAIEIGKVVNLISNIANQTNMLALNASIEAAGAGEAGKGFAVVANEVKDLAKQTTEATQMIHQQVQDIQKNSSEVESFMDYVVEKIGKINHLNVDIIGSVQEQEEVTSTIMTSVDNVTDAAASVTRSSHELALASEEVARSAAEAATGTNEIAQSGSLAAQESTTVAENSIKNQTVSSKVKEHTNHIFSASTEVQKMGLQMLNHMESLNKEANMVSNMTSRLEKGAEELRVSTTSFTF